MSSERTASEHTSMSDRLGMPSHRDRGAMPDADVVIAPDTGRARGNSYQVFLWGKPHSRRSTLAEAKKSITDIVGDLTWTKVQGDQEPHHDPVHGYTVEFNDAPFYIVADLSDHEQTVAGSLLGQGHPDGQPGRVLALDEHHVWEGVPAHASAREKEQGVGDQGGLSTGGGAIGARGSRPAHLRQPAMLQSESLAAGNPEGQLSGHGRARSQGAGADPSGGGQQASQTHRDSGAGDSTTSSRRGIVEDSRSRVRGQHEDRLSNYSKRALDSHLTAIPETKTSGFDETEVIRRGVCWAISDTPKGLELAKKCVNHTITAAEIITAMQPLGIWWGISDQYGGMSEYESHAESNFGSPAVEMMAEMKEDVAVGRHGGVEVENWFGCDVAVVLTAKRPVFNGEPWDPSKHNPAGSLWEGNSFLPRGARLEILEVRYDAGDGYRTLSAGGIRTTAVIANSQEYSWDQIKAKYPLYDAYGMDDAVNELAHISDGEMVTSDLSYTVEDVPIRDIKFQRYSESDSRVQSVLAGYRSGKPVPPVLLVSRVGQLHTVDGHHRLSAEEILGMTTVSAVVAHSVQTDRYSGAASIGYAGRNRRKAEHTANDIKNYLDMLNQLQEQMGKPQPGFKYRSTDQVIRDYGQAFHQIGKTLPKGLVRGEMKMCFSNAFHAAMENPDLTYCEGYANAIIPMMHAWVVDRSGTVYDPTWEKSGSDYFGVPFNTDWLRQHILEKGYYGVFGIDWTEMAGNAILRDGLPMAAINRTGSAGAREEVGSDHDRDRHPHQAPLRGGSGDHASGERRHSLGSREDIVLSVSDVLIIAHRVGAQVRDQDLVESAVGQQQWHEDIFDRAAALGYSLAKNHPMVDGNKRTAFVAAVTLVQMVGYRCKPRRTTAVSTMVGVAEGSVSREQFSAWLRAQCGLTGSLLATAAPLDDWRPTKGMFAPGQPTLDSRIFDLSTNLLKTSVITAVIGALDGYWTPMFGDWRAWAKVYLAGSGASYWWDSDTDLDLLVGVDLDLLRTARPANKDISDVEIVAHLNKTLMDFRPQTAAMVFEPGTKPFDVTYFVNEGAYDILDIHPYAAIDLTNDTWVVKPPVLPADWGPSSISDGTWLECEMAAREAEQVLSLPEPERTLAGVVLFDWVHEGRKAAYSNNGGGWLDPGNVIYQFLSQHPEHLLRRLFICKHPEQADAADALEKTAAAPRFWHGSPSGDLRGGAYGLHVGSREAARQALEARIGQRADGKDWDGSREYGKTLLMGKSRIPQSGHYRYVVGYSVDAPDEDHYPTGKASYGDGTRVSMSAKPDLFEVEIVGEMGNTPNDPRTDAGANANMKRQMSRGRATKGYYYTNIGEDDGSLSAVVPGPSHVRRTGRRTATKKAASQTYYHGTDVALAIGSILGGTDRRNYVDSVYSGAGVYLAGTPEWAFFYAVVGAVSAARFSGSAHVYEVAADQAKPVRHSEWLAPTATVISDETDRAAAAFAARWEQDWLPIIKQANDSDVDTRIMVFEFQRSLNQHGLSVTSAKTSGKKGELPEGLEFKSASGAYGMRVVEAWLGESRIGLIGWVYDDGPVIETVEVDPKYQRRGVATALYQQALRRDPELLHSRERTKSGQEWAQSTGQVPRRTKILPDLPSFVAARAIDPALDPVSAYEPDLWIDLTATSQTPSPNWVRAFFGTGEKQYENNKPYIGVGFEVIPHAGIGVSREALQTPIPWDCTNLQQVVHAAEAKAQPYYGGADKEMFEQWAKKSLGYGLIVGSTQKTRLVGLSKTLGGPWQVPPSGEVGGKETWPEFLGLLRSDPKKAWHQVCTDIADAQPPGYNSHPLFDPAKVTETLIYRGMTLRPGEDPMTSVKEGDASGVGSSWTLDLVGAKAIAERGGAGFTNANAVVGQPTKFQARPRPYTKQRPVVLRAKVDLTKDGVALFTDGRMYYVSEQEVNVERGTEIDITGVMEAKAIFNSKDKVEAERQADLAKDTAGKEGDFFASYPGHYTWGSFRSTRTKRTASQPGVYYHVGTLAPNKYDPRKGWVHLGSAHAAGMRADLMPQASLWRVHIGPHSPANSASSPADDYDANRIDQWLVMGSPIKEGKPTIPKAQISGSSDQADLDDAVKTIKFRPGSTDAIYYRNNVEDPGSVSVMVSPARIDKVELLDGGQLALFASREAAVTRPAGAVSFALLDQEDPELALQQLFEHAEDVGEQPDDPQGTTALVYPKQKTTLGPWDRALMTDITKDHGFSFHDHPGDAPTDGFMVSIDKDDEQTVPLNDIDGRVVADYMSVHASELRDPNNFLGGWVYKNNVFLDISRHVADEDQAMRLAKANKQLGIYDLSSGQTVLTKAG